MRIYSILDVEKKTSFNGTRTARNTVTQLCKDNKYSLTEPNQRNITNAINELSTVKGNKNIRFLLDAASKSKYSTNIKLQDMPKHDWRSMLFAAAVAAASITPLLSKGIKEKLTRVNEQKKLTEDEKQILAIRESILQKVDKKQIEKESKGGMKNYERNLDYFIISSETTIADKKYVLDRLNYLLSDDYKINPQLKDKKSLVFAEMINDMAIHTPGQKIPNIKAINQKHHGMCAAISIVRKMLAYEDKPNYVDSLLSELDDSNHITVYDRSKLGSGEKIEVKKVAVDFDSALAKGYRIIDASAMHWMQIAQMGGSANIAFDEYHPFDRKNFDVNADTFFHTKFDDDELSSRQNYYQALIRAKEVLNNYKADKIKEQVTKTAQQQSKHSYLKTLNDIHKLLNTKISALSDQFDADDLIKIRSGLLNLEHKYSEKIKENDSFAYIPNEEESIKKEKIKNYLLSSKKIDSISDQDVEGIFDLVEYSHELNRAYNENKVTGITKAENAYEVAAAFRYQVVQELGIEERLENYMLAEKITNKENLILKALDDAIIMLDEGSPKTDLIIAQLSKMFSTPTDTPQDMIYSLACVRDKVNEMLTTGLDDIYNSLTLTNRKEAIKPYIECLLDMVEEDNKDVIKDVAEMYSVKKDKDTVANALRDSIYKLENGSDEDYEQIFDIMENTSQIKAIADIYKSIITQIGNGEDDELITQFMKANNIEEADNPEPVINKFKEIQDNINSIHQFLKGISNVLKVYDEDGSLILSADPKDILLKKLEAKGSIPSSKDLHVLQEHLEKIAQDSSADEFQSRQGKVKDRSLTKFSDSEKLTINTVYKNINRMNSYVQKKLESVQRILKDSLEEQKRVIGVNNGDYWVREGSSGLSKDQEIKVLEYMTGRPYYVTKDIKHGIEKIKEGPYSGISSSSVFHDRIGGHAQYIADIAPVTITKTDENGNVKEEKREILFQDNSWGASEKENRWIDSNGMERTDYSDNRGGTLGYITNQEYRNGNFVDRILNEMFVNADPEKIDSKVYKRLKPDREKVEMPQYYNIILQGKSPELKNITDMLHDAIFIPNTRYIENLKEQSASLTYDEAKAVINSLSLVGKNWKSTYQQLCKRIYPEFGEKIKTKENYDKLANDDYLKVVLEQIALKRNYQILDRSSELAKVRNVKDLQKFKNGQKARAVNSFKYAFGKSRQIVKYLAESLGEKEVLDLDKIYKKYNLSLTEDEREDLVAGFGIDSDEFDGSVEDTINLMFTDISVAIDNIIVNPEASKEVKEYFLNYFKDNLYFKETDINNPKIQHIIKFIDREFNPDDDKELVKIYRKIQDMTSEEFKKEILPRIKPEDIKLGTTTGYDILKELQRYDEKAETDFINTVYYGSIVNELNKENYDTEYDYEKLSRRPKYNSTYDFETIYRMYSADLSYLTLPKLFNKYKGHNLRKYGAYPAYPKIDCISTKFIDTTFDSFFDTIQNDIEIIKSSRDLKTDYALVHKLMNYDKKLKPDDVLSDYQYKNINFIVGQFLTLNYNDDSIADAVHAAEDILEIPKGTPWKAYIEPLHKIINMATELESTTSIETLDKLIAYHQSSIYFNTDSFTKAFVQERYQAGISETINNLKRAMIKKNSEKVEEYKSTLYSEFIKYHILQNPDELLNSYVLSCAKNSPLHPHNKILGTILTRGLGYAKLLEVQDILMEAIENGMEMDVKSIFNTYKVELKDGTTELMGSEEMITQMINMLILDDKKDTAIMFMDKLGLGETYVNAMAKRFDYDAIKEVLKESVTFTNDYTLFLNDIAPIVERTRTNLANNKENYAADLDTLKRTISTEAKKHSLDRKDSVMLLGTIDSIKENFLKNPSENYEVVFKSIFNNALEEINKTIRNCLNEMNETMHSNDILLDLINEIMLKYDSEEYKTREEINQKFTEIAEYYNSLGNLQDIENSDKI